MSDVCRSPIREPVAWYGPDLKRNKDWLFVLSDDEISELESAIRCSDGIPFRQIKVQDFPLGQLKKKLLEIKESVDRGIGVALVRGVPVEKWSEDDAVRALWGMGLHIGVPQPQDSKLEVFHHVRDTGQKIGKNSNLRFYQTNDEQTFHNDGGDIVMLLCRKAARQGGISLMVSAVTIFNEVLNQEPLLAEVLQQPFFFDARGQQLTGKPSIQSVPIFVWHGSNLNALYKRPYINFAQRFQEVPRLSGLQIEALNLVDRLCADPKINISFSMCPGDIQVANNFSIFHARSSFLDYSDPSEKRHMMRLWLGLDNGRILPEVYRGTREFGPLFEIPNRSDSSNVERID